MRGEPTDGSTASSFLIGSTDFRRDDDTVDFRRGIGISFGRFSSCFLTCPPFVLHLYFILLRAWKKGKPEEVLCIYLQALVPLSSSSCLVLSRPSSVKFSSQHGDNAFREVLGGVE